MSTQKTALLIVGTGFEEVEALAPVDVLRRAGVRCTIASREQELLVTGRNGIRVQADELIEAAGARQFDCIVVPGGPGTSALRKDRRVLELIRAHAGAGKLVSAICAAPTVLLDAGILPGPRHTGHASIANELPEMDHDLAVVVDGQVITSRGAGTAVHFGLALAAALVGQDTADEVAASIHFPG
jgi:4-methyl-5(b-hydroxyethyl)-thiazole monophosphate biosynthesis